MLFSHSGARKYLTVAERAAFIRAAKRERPDITTFCLTLAFTGARVSEVLALTPSRIDRLAHIAIIECLKKRRAAVFRAVPLPESLLRQLGSVHTLASAQCDLALCHERLWPWSRMTAWQHVKAIMCSAGIPAERSMPKALRHAFGVASIQAGIPLNIVQRWMGHSRMDTTAIYTNVTGAEELMLAKRMWRTFP